MEEKNKNKKENEVRKPSYEQLEAAYNNLVERTRAQLKEMDLSNLFQRLNYLFAVVQNSEKFEKAGHSDFLNKCIDEIVGVMTLEENKEEEEKK